jgi:hypothetical protein
MFAILGNEMSRPPATLTSMRESITVENLLIERQQVGS